MPCTSHGTSVSHLGCQVSQRDYVKHNWCFVSHRQMWWLMWSLFSRHHITTQVSNCCCASWWVFSWPPLTSMSRFNVRYSLTISSWWICEKKKKNQRIVLSAPFPLKVLVGCSSWERNALCSGLTVTCLHRRLLARHIRLQQEIAVIILLSGTINEFQIPSHLRCPS